MILILKPFFFLCHPVSGGRHSGEASEHDIVVEIEAHHEEDDDDEDEEDEDDRHDSQMVTQDISDDDEDNTQGELGEP